MAQGEQSRRPLVLLGAGGHARSIAAASANVGRMVLAVHGKTDRAWPVPVLSDPHLVLDLLSSSGARVVVAIGDNHTRMTEGREWSPFLDFLVASTATVSAEARVGRGTVVLEHAHVGPDTHLGENVIVNSAAVVEHDCEVADGAHISPGARLLGGVRIGRSALVGAGATVLPGLAVGAGARVGAGAVVTRDVGPDETVVGMPARVVTHTPQEST